MKSPTLPHYELRKTRLIGALSIVHAILVDGVVVHEQLSPYSVDEIEQRIASHLRNEPVRPVREVIYKPKPGPKRSASVNERGFRWKEEEPSE